MRLKSAFLGWKSRGWGACGRSRRSHPVPSPHKRVCRAGNAGKASRDRCTKHQGGSRKGIFTVCAVGRVFPQLLPDTLLNVFLAIAVDNLANAQELTKVGGTSLCSKAWGHPEVSLEPCSPPCTAHRHLEVYSSSAFCISVNILCLVYPTLGIAHLIFSVSKSRGEAINSFFWLIGSSDRSKFRLCGAVFAPLVTSLHCREVYSPSGFLISGCREYLVFSLVSHFVSLTLLRLVMDYRIKIFQSAPGKTICRGCCEHSGEMLEHSCLSPGVREIRGRKAGPGRGWQ